MYISWLGWCLVNSAQNQVGPIHSREVSGLVPGGGGPLNFFSGRGVRPGFPKCGQWRRSRGDGGIYPPNIWPGGDGLCNHPPQRYAYLIDGRHALNITSSISSRPTIYPWKTGSFYASISRWVITYCFDINVKICNVLICLELIKMLPKSIHQIAPFSFQNSKIFQLLRGGAASEGGTSPLRHPPVRASAQLALTRHPIIPPMFKTDLRPWVWCGACELTFASEKGGLWAENFQIWGLVSWKFPNLGACELKIWGLVS